MARNDAAERKAAAEMAVVSALLNEWDWFNETPACPEDEFYAAGRVWWRKETYCEGWNERARMDGGTEITQRDFDAELLRVDRWVKDNVAAALRNKREWM